MGYVKFSKNLSEEGIVRLKKDRTREGDEYYLRITKKINMNDKVVERTIYRIGYVSIDDVEVIEHWKEVVRIMNEVMENQKKILEEIEDEEDLRINDTEE